jgi:hypothetical protein
LSYERHDHGVQGVIRDRSNLFVTNDAVAIDDECFGNTVNAEIEAEASFLIERGSRIGIAMASEPGERVDARVLVIEPDDRYEA